MIFKDLGLIYLATPYRKYKLGLEEAYMNACHVAGKVIAKGGKVYSPIAHLHGIAQYSGIDPCGDEIWLPQLDAMCEKSDTLVIAKMHGWWDSSGIMHEFKHFYDRTKPIYYLNPDTLELTRGTDY